MSDYTMGYDPNMPPAGGGGGGFGHAASGSINFPAPQPWFKPMSPYEQEGQNLDRATRKLDYNAASMGAAQKSFGTANSNRQMLLKQYNDEQDRVQMIKDRDKKNAYEEMRRYLDLEKMRAEAEKFRRQSANQNGQGAPNAMGQIVDYQNQPNPYYDRSQQLNNAGAPDVSNYLNSILGR